MFLRNPHHQNAFKKDIREGVTFLISALCIGAVVFIIDTVFKLKAYRLLEAPTYNPDLSPCPLPNGPYRNSCGNIASQLLTTAQPPQCNFTTTCILDKPGGQGQHCAMTLVQQQLMLPAFTQFNFRNTAGNISTRLQADAHYEQPYTWLLREQPDLTVLETRKITNVAQVACTYSV